MADETPEVYHVIRFGFNDERITLCRGTECEICREQEERVTK